MESLLSSFLLLGLVRRHQFEPGGCNFVAGCLDESDVNLVWYLFGLVDGLAVVNKT